MNAQAVICHVCGEPIKVGDDLQLAHDLAVHLKCFKVGFVIYYFANISKLTTAY